MLDRCTGGRVQGLQVQNLDRKCLRSQLQLIMLALLVEFEPFNDGTPILFTNSSHLGLSKGECTFRYEGRPPALGKHGVTRLVPLIVPEMGGEGFSTQ